MAWRLNEPGLSLNEDGYTLNGNPVVDALKNYYTGGIALGKQLLKRALGF